MARGLFENPFERERFLHSGHNELGGASPVTAIKTGKVDEVKRLLEKLRINPTTEQLTMMMRMKAGALRIAVTDPAKIDDVLYVAVEMKKCWCSTFKGWGKEATDPVIEAANGKRYRVKLEEVQ